MNQSKIFSVLICVLAVACVILAACLWLLDGEINYLPESSVEDIVALLAEEGITIDPELIPTRRQRGDVYVCASENYSETVASLLGESDVRSVYRIPEGEIILLYNGAKFEFGDEYTFKFTRRGTWGTAVELGIISDGEMLADEKKRLEAGRIAAEFIDRGSRNFDSVGGVSIETIVSGVWERDGVIYVLCTREIDGAEINRNVVLCAIENGEITEAYGTWCFLTLDEAYSAQLSDVLNILFNVKKEIARDSVGEAVKVESIRLSYSLYFWSGEEEFCLIPCWQIVTDTMGEYIYNAIDSTLYTKNQ